MPGFALSAQCRAPVEEVWKLLFDPARFPQWWTGVETVRTGPRKHSAHSRMVMGGAGFGGGYGENACAGGRQGLPSMRSCRTSMALRPCLRAVSM